jgi:hypothetical protein
MFHWLIAIALASSVVLVLWVAAIALAGHRRVRALDSEWLAQEDEAPAQGRALRNAGGAAVSTRSS